MPHSLSITTLKKRADFLRLNKGGKRVTPYFILRYLPSGIEGSRVGLTVTAKCGNAVARNRIKRRLRAAVRAVMPQHAAGGMDYVLIARAEAADKLCNDDFRRLCDALVGALSAIHA